jgi:DNA-binding transcriptional regulator YiaG
MTGTQFATLRSSMRLSQLELAEELEVSESAISRWERLDRVPMVAALALEVLINGQLSDIARKRFVNMFAKAAQS